MLRQALEEILVQLTPEIDRWPRREPGQVLVANKLLKYADMHSFYWHTLQIFRDRLYHFTCNTDSPLILDCGAHIGLASLYFKDVFPNARIHAFEADPEIATMCHANLRAFGFDAVSVDASAVWIDDGGVSFADTKDDSGFINADQDEGLKIPSVRLKDFLIDEKVHLLKLDVEGAEFKILEDCDSVLKNVERLIIELHVLRAEEGRVGTVLSQLEDNGFRYVFNDLRYATWLEDRKPTPFAFCPTEQYVITVYAWQP